MKHGLSLLTMLLCAAMAQAEVLVQEDFNYPLGDDLTGHGWYTQYGDPSGITLTNGLEFTGYIGSSVGNAAIIDCKSGSSQPHLAFKEVSKGTIYAAFLFQPVINYKKGYFFALRDNNKAEFNLNARVLLDADSRIGLTFADNQKAVFTEEALDGQKVYLIVVKYTILEGANNDEVSLFVLEQPAATEPTEPTIRTLVDNSKKDIAPANVQLRGYDADGWLVIDGLRVATTWEEAVAPAASSDLSDLTAYSQGVDIYTVVGNYIGHFDKAEDATLPAGMYIYKTQSGTHKVIR